jgi:hypothetical protein
MQLPLVFASFRHQHMKKTMWQEELWLGAFMLMHVVKVPSTECMLLSMFQENDR